MTGCLFAKLIRSRRCTDRPLDNAAEEQLLYRQAVTVCSSALRNSSCTGPPSTAEEHVGKMADIRRRPTLPPNYNINQMRLIHELKVAFPSVPDETVRLCLKKVRVF